MLLFVYTLCWYRGLWTILCSTSRLRQGRAELSWGQNKRRAGGRSWLYMDQRDEQPRTWPLIVVQWPATFSESLPLAGVDTSPEERQRGQQRERDVCLLRMARHWAFVLLFKQSDRSFLKRNRDFEVKTSGENDSRIIWNLIFQLPKPEVAGPRSASLLTAGSETPSSWSAQIKKSTNISFFFFSPPETARSDREWLRTNAGHHFHPGRMNKQTNRSPDVWSPDGELVLRKHFPIARS